MTDDSRKYAPSEQSFAALRHHAFRAYFITSALAMMADSIEHVISYWMMYEKFHSQALGGFAVVSHWLPFLLFSVYSGALADRFDPRRIIQAGMLCFIAGSVQHNYGTRELSRLGGLLKQAPKMGWILGFCAMASLGLPGLAGFWGEFPAVLSTFNPGGDLSQPLFRTYMVIAAIGTVLAAGYLLWMLQKVAFGVPKQEFADAHIHDVSSYEWTAWVPILLLIVALGVFPNIIFRVTDDAVTCQTAAPFVSKTTVPLSPSLKCPVSPGTPIPVQTTSKVSGG